MLAALVSVAGTVPALAGPSIEWRVANPFRFFNDPADTEIHRATFISLTPEERRSPVLAAERQLGQRHPDGWAATMYRKTCWNWTRNRYECPDGESYITPESHAVVAEVKGIDDAEVVCTWQTGAGKRRRGRQHGEASTQACSEPVELDIPYPEGALVTVSVGGVEVARQRIVVKDLFVVGMGDSFGSGEGNPDIPVRLSPERTADYSKPSKNGDGDLTGYPARIGAWKQIGDKTFIEESARWLDQACHRSLYSYQMRVALQIALEDPHRAVTYAGFACSGAETTFGLFLRYKGNEWVPNPPDLSQISAAAAAQCGREEAEPQDLPEAYHMKGQVEELKGGLVLRKCEAEKARKIDLVLLSIGGNDIGFSRLLANAVLADQSTLKKLGGWFGQVHGLAEARPQLARLGDRYKSLNRALHNILHIPWNESDRIVLTGYPGLALLGDGSEVCPDGDAGMEVYPDFRLSEARAKDGTQIAEKLHRLMRQSARTYGWTFAESHRRQFIGRGICAGFTDSAFSIADDLRLPRRIGHEWRPYNPSDYRAYVPRQRWFRTPNDAYLTGNFHVEPSLIQKALKLESLQWFQLLLASTYSGAFHPTAEGHAAIADATIEQARAVIEKYNGATRVSSSP
ncbi:MAG: hypothetical protein AB1749_04370 [Pseudomonadota bacterium]